MKNAPERPPVTPSQPLRIGRWGWLVQTAGILAAILGLGTLIIGTQVDNFIYILTGSLLLGAGLYSFFLGKRLSSPPAWDWLKQDPRAPIVFVRSFTDEQNELSIGGFFRAAWTQFKLQSKNTITPMSSPWGPTLQWQLAILFREIGPYVAIGKPGEKLAALGAARMYVRDDEWQEVIRKLFGRARLIILRMGSTPGLNWELNEIHQHIDPTRVLFILPHKEEDYQAFCVWINPRLAAPLPDKLPSARFITLNQDWTPLVLEQQGMLYDTLEPYLNQNNILRKDISLWYRIVYNSTAFNVLLAIGIMLATIIAASELLGIIQGR